MFNNLIPWHKKNELAAAKSEERPLLDLHREMDRLLDNFFGDIVPNWSEQRAGGMFNPRFDVTETEQEVELTAELPGVNEKDLEISLENNVLCIKGEKKESEEEKGKHYYLSERRYGAFRRYFTLPDGIDGAKIAAAYHDGVLKLTLPKAPEAQAKRRKIEVNVA